MHRVDDAVRVGLDALRYAVLQVTAAPARPAQGALIPAQPPAFGPVPGARPSARSARLAGLLMSEALDQHTGPPVGTGGHRPGQHDDDAEATRIVALVDLARSGDAGHHHGDSGARARTLYALTERSETERSTAERGISRATAEPGPAACTH